MKKWTGMASMLAAGLLTASPVAAADEPFELSFQTLYNPAQTQMQEVFIPFAKEVEKRTNGSLKVSIFGVGTLVPASEEANSVKAGNLDIGQSNLPHPKETPYNYLLGMIPDMCRTIEDTIKVGPILYSMPEIKKEYDLYGIPIGFTSYVPQVVASVNSPIKTPADMKGKRMLVTSSNQALVAEAWGAIPVMVTLSDIYIGLQRGMGECYMSGSSWHKGSKIYEVAKHMTVVGYPNTNLMPFLINKELFEELSDNQRKILLETAQEYFGPVIQKSWEKDYQETVKIFADAGVQLYTPNEEEQKAWTEASARVIPVALERLKELGVNDGAAFLERVNKALADNKF